MPRPGLPLSFVLALAAMLAAGCAAWFLNAVSAVSSHESFNVLEWVALEADLVSYELVFFSGAREAELERHVPELSSLWNKDSIGGCKSEILGSGTSRICAKDNAEKPQRLTLVLEGKVATFEFQPHLLF